MSIKSLAEKYKVPLDWFSSKKTTQTKVTAGNSAEEELEKDLQEAQDIVSILQQTISEELALLDDIGYVAYTEKDVIEFVANGRPEYYQDLRQSVSSAILGLTMCLQQALRCMSASRKLPYQEFGNLDMFRITSIAKGLDKRVFYKVNGGMKLDTAVSILIDESGSMHLKRDTTQLVAIALGEALTQLGIPFEIIGTSTYGKREPVSGFTRWNPLHLRIFKAFSENWSTVNHRMVNLKSSANNVDGEAVEFAARRLSGRKEKRKIIFSLSDGMPDAGQGNRSAFATNLRDVCGKCRKSGIEVYGWGILTDDPKEYYGEKWFIGLKNLNSMGMDFFKQVTKIILGGI